MRGPASLACSPHSSLVQRWEDCGYWTVPSSAPVLPLVITLVVAAIGFLIFKDQQRPH